MLQHRHIVFFKLSEKTIFRLWQKGASYKCLYLVSKIRGRQKTQRDGKQLYKEISSRVGKSQESYIKRKIEHDVSVCRVLF